jgi:hypothetical protein
MAVDWNILGKYFGVPVRANQDAARKALQVERGRSTAALTKAKKLAVAHPSIVIDREGPGTYWVTCTKLTGDADPCDGASFCNDGREVLECVETYIKALTELQAKEQN